MKNLLSLLRVLWETEFPKLLIYTIIDRSSLEMSDEPYYIDAKQKAPISSFMKSGLLLIVLRRQAVVSMVS